ncbi:unnamed protein product [Callosobruchus maculatus]|uniref:Uncharacterized protein n=1 Tax=Callosobruchus maculatus TaxID=64391 RepID=A0A653DP12_CALMS|nr:unnamed protein product [Callosobruchus maculatus]
MASDIGTYSEAQRYHVNVSISDFILPSTKEIHRYEKLKAVTVWRTVLNQLKSRVSKQSGVSSQTDMAMKELIKRFERLDDIAILCSAKG